MSIQTAIAAAAAGLAALHFIRAAVRDLRRSRTGECGGCHECPAARGGGILSPVRKRKW